MLKPIVNYNGYYISDDGTVYCDLGKGNRDRTHRVEKYPIKPRFTKTGYARIYARNSLTGQLGIISEIIRGSSLHSMLVNLLNNRLVCIV